MNALASVDLAGNQAAAGLVAAFTLPAANGEVQTNPAFVNMIGLFLNPPTAEIPATGVATAPAGTAFFKTATAAQIADAMIRTMLGGTPAAASTPTVMAPANAPATAAQAVTPSVTEAPEESGQGEVEVLPLPSTTPSAPASAQAQPRKAPRDAANDATTQPAPTATNITATTASPVAALPTFFTSPPSALNSLSPGNSPSPAETPPPANQASISPAHSPAPVEAPPPQAASRETAAEPTLSEAKVAFTAVLTPIMAGTPQAAASSAQAAAAASSSDPLPAAGSQATAAVNRDAAQQQQQPSQDTPPDPSPRPPAASADQKFKPPAVKTDDAPAPPATSAPTTTLSMTTLSTPAAPAAPAPAAVTDSARPSVPPSPGATAAEALRHADALAPAAPAARTGAAQEISIRIAQPDASPVDLRVIERSGQVRVDVRTNDAAMQTSLRQDLGTLTSSLQRAGYHAETFTPAAARAASGAQAGSQDAQQDPSQSRGGSGDSGGGRRQQQQQQKRTGNWLEEQEDQS